MRKLALLFVLGACLLGSARPAAAAVPCGLPQSAPLWIDFASVELASTFARPGVIVAASSGNFPAQMRAAGAKTVYWDMYLNARVGQPSAPAAPAGVGASANRLFDYAALQADCATPLIVENELFGAGLTTPWSDSNAQYRANVLTYLQTLAARGALPVLLINSQPYTAGAAGAWWRAVAAVAWIVREDYFPAPVIAQQGPILGSRVLRTQFRQGVEALTSLGIPPSRVGIMLGFQTTPGFGGREGLKPTSAWLEVTKLQVLAAREIAAETGIGSIWSWGWGEWSKEEQDPDKQAAACVWLWTRDQSLCNGPAAAGAGFDRSLVEGQINLPRSIQCSFGARRIGVDAIQQLQLTTGDRDVAYSTIFARYVIGQAVHLSRARVLAAERAVILLRFHGSRAAYEAALARAHSTVETARGILADELTRALLERSLPAAAPAPGAVERFYQSYPDVLVRAVRVTPAPLWLNGRTRGVALSAVAPPQLFTLPADASATITTVTGTYRVHVIGAATPLGLLPFDRVAGGIAGALSAFSRGEAFDRWLAARENAELQTAICQRDDLPAPGAIDLTALLPFLSPNG